MNAFSRYLAGREDEPPMEGSALPAGAASSPGSPGLLNNHSMARSGLPSYSYQYHAPSLGNDLVKKRKPTLSRNALRAWLCENPISAIMPICSCEGSLLAAFEPPRSIGASMSSGTFVERILPCTNKRPTHRDLPYAQTAIP